MSMGPERVAAFAWLVVECCQEARPGELVLAEATPSTRAAALEGARGLDHAGAVPVTDRADPGYLPTSRYPDPLAMWEELTGYVSLRTVGDQLAARRGGAAGERSAPGRVPAGGAGPAGGAAAEAAVRTLRMTKRKTNTTWPDET